MGSSSRSSCFVRQRLLWRARVEFCEVDVSGTGRDPPSCWSLCVGSYISVICYFSKQCCNLPFCEYDGGGSLFLHSNARILRHLRNETAPNRQVLQYRPVVVLHRSPV